MLIASPYDRDEVTTALDCALSMLPAERTARRSAMPDVIRENNVHNWQARFAGDLQYISPRSKEGHLRGRIVAFPRPA